MTRPFKRCCVDRLTPAAMLLLVAVVVGGCAGDDDDEQSGTTTEVVVVTDKASGEPAAKAEADRASKIKTHIDTSDVVKVFPPTIVKDGDVNELKKGTPERALLEWWQAFQFRDVRTVKALTSEETLKAIGSSELTELVGRTGLQGIEVLDASTDGDVAVVNVGLLNFSAPRGEPPPKTPTNSQPETFTMKRDGDAWLFAQTEYLQLKLNAIQKRKAQPSS
jgi:hypothetical protein